MPTGIEEFAGTVAASAVSLLETGAVTSTISAMPTASRYADFEAGQSCNPEFSPELLEGSYADPGACVCFDDGPSSSGSEPEAQSSVQPAPQPVAGDKPSSAPHPVSSPTAAPTTPSPEPQSPPPPDPPTHLLEIDTRYVRFTVDFHPLNLLLPIPGSSPYDVQVEVDKHQMVRDILDIHPDPENSDLPGDDVRESMRQDPGLAKKILKAAAGAVGAGGVADSVDSLSLLFGEDEEDLDPDKKAEYERRMVEESSVLVLELALALVAGRLRRTGGGEVAKTPRKSPSWSQLKKKLEIYKEKTGRPSPDAPVVFRGSTKPDVPSSLGRKGNSVTGIWNENPNIQVTVTSGAANPSNIKSVEYVLRDVQNAKPSIKAETSLYRAVLRRLGFIEKGMDAGHANARSIIEFEDPANYFNELARGNRVEKNLYVEKRSRELIQSGKGGQSLTLTVKQELSESLPIEQVVTSRHTLTTEGSKTTLLDLSVDLLTGKITNHAPTSP